jgi:hypothetical protein
LQWLIQHHGLGKTNKADRIATWLSAFEYHFRSADEPGDIVSESPLFAIIEEAGRQPDDMWDFLEPAMRVNDAMQWRFGTPRGKNRFYADSLRGLDADGNSPLISGRPPVDPHFVTFHAPSSIAPWWDHDAIEAARAHMSPAMFDQEIMAKFLEGAASLFGDFSEVCVADPENPNPDGAYVIGVDLAKHQDFTAIRVFRVDCVMPREVHCERFNALDWLTQKRRIVEVVKRYNDALVVLDATGIGDVVYDDLSRLGLNIEPFKFSPSSKTVLIENFVGKVASKQIRLLKKEHDEVGWQEMADFEYEVVSPKGHALRSDVKFRYGTQKGSHDDTVIARALAAHGLGQGAFVGVY